MSARTKIRLTPMRRHLAAIVTIAISTGFVAVMILAGNLMIATMRAQSEDTYGSVDLVATVSDMEKATKAPHDASIAYLWPNDATYSSVDGPDGRSALLEFRRVPPQQVRPVDLQRGGTARTPNDIVLSASAAETLHATTGDTITISDPGNGEKMTLKVSGVAEPTRGEAFGLVSVPSAQLTDVNAATVLGEADPSATYQWMIDEMSGTDTAATRAALERQGFTVKTGQEVIDEQVDDMTKGMAALGAVLGVFVVIALVTAAVVVSNTLSVTFAQRTRSLALMRAVGATRGQVAKVVLKESLTVGLIGSLVGVVGTIVLGQLLLLGCWAMGWLHGFIAIPVSILAVVLPLIAGALVTVLAGFLPLLRAIRVTPMQALRRDGGAIASRRFGIAQIIGLVVAVIGFALLAGGAALSLAGSPTFGVLIGVLGGIVSLAGVLMALSLLTQPLARVGGALLGLIGGLPAKLATTSVLRDKRRSAATVGALLIGTSLMTMMAVGARTADASISNEIDSAMPVDVTISAPDLAKDSVARIGAVKGVQEASAAKLVDVPLKHGAEPTTILAAPQDRLEKVSRRADVGEKVAGSTVLMGKDTAKELGLSDGQRIEVPGPNGARTALTVAVDEHLDLVVMSDRTAATIEGTHEPAVIARLAAPDSPERDGRDVGTIAEDLYGMKLADGGKAPADVEMPVLMRETLSTILNVMLGVSIGLLGVAVVVAIVGVASTLSLGVIERSGENALLRALGSTRGQIRRMLGWEGILLSGVGALIGVLLGIVYGVLGITSTLGAQTVISIPWGQVAAVIALSILAGFLASIVPGIRASKAQPAAALAAADE